MKKIFLLLFVLSCSANIFAQIFPDSWTGGKYYTVNGAKLWTVTSGTGTDPLIIIPGGPGGNHLSYRVFDSLTIGTNIQVIYFDAFGRGKSDTAKDVKEYSLERDIEDIEGLRKAMHLDRISLLGHSYGSLVAQGYAVKYGAHLSHLIIADGFHSFVMWQENDDNSNHEIKTNYPEVWEELMKIREAGAISSDQLHQDIYGQVPYGFCMRTTPKNLPGAGQGPTRILSMQSSIIKWWVRTVILS